LLELNFLSSGNKKKEEEISNRKRIQPERKEDEFVHYSGHAWQEYN
jgi:hypothetical protein